MLRTASGINLKLLDRSTSSKIGAGIFTRYLSSISRPVSRCRNIPLFQVNLPSIPRSSFRRFTGEAEASKIVRAQSQPVDVSAWTDIGIHPSLAEQLITAYPHIRYLTPAQKLFLLAIGADKEVFLKDEMGRGKTLALALASLNIVLQSPSNSMEKGVKVMIIVPTPYLAQQIYSHLNQLSPRSTESETPLFTLLRSPPSDQPGIPYNGSLMLPDYPILVSTAKDLLSYEIQGDQSIPLPFLRYIFLDEPDTLIGSVPSRHTTREMLFNHPLFKHPPPIIKVLNDLLSIKQLQLEQQQEQRNDTTRMDFSKRRNDINTIWTSATLNKDFKRLIKTRGWIRKGNNNLVDLDFTTKASDKSVEIRERLLFAIENQLRAKSSSSSTSPITSTTIDNNNNGNDKLDIREGQHRHQHQHQQMEPYHYGLVIDPINGSISSLDLNSISTYIPPNKLDTSASSSSSLSKAKETKPFEKHNNTIPIEMIESLSLIHITSPPPADRYSLILPPEGISLSTVSEELSNLGMSSLILTPELVDLNLDLEFAEMDKEMELKGQEKQREDTNKSQDQSQSQEGQSGQEGGDSQLPMLLAHRSSIPGLNLPSLHTIYLLDGLDVKGLSKKQRKTGGVKDRYGFYHLVSGRLGRLGMIPSSSSSSSAEIQVNENGHAIGPTKGNPNDRQRVISLVMGGTEDEKRLKEMFSEPQQEGKLREWDMKGLEVALQTGMAD
ncbi:uncharacterized protein IL334_001805 [Kwoniella shivajii]|uniref:ATP-dependent RNA helicase n=1 Tax=Kwoniella shivajii TaxID=564305 RepID=A0ABZ1CSY7_9TREE|nr:hypothetical protein IL334_001805 [Kwoniella shivajii]